MDRDMGSTPGGGASRASKQGQMAAVSEACRVVCKGTTASWEAGGKAVQRGGLGTVLPEPKTS